MKILIIKKSYKTDSQTLDTETHGLSYFGTEGVGTSFVFLAGTFKLKKVLVSKL